MIRFVRVCAFCLIARGATLSYSVNTLPLGLTEEHPTVGADRKTRQGGRGVTSSGKDAGGGRLLNVL